MTADLSMHHNPLSDLFPAPTSADGWDAYRLTDAQLESYQENGYVAGVRVLTEAQIEALRTELERFVSPDHPGRELWYEYHSNESPDPNQILFHALGAWRIAKGFHDLLWNPAWTVPAAQLLEGPVRFWHDQLFCKPARHGGVVAWHQDYSYWTRTRPLAHLTCWIGLDDATAENGCLEYVPGSHRWELLPITGLAGDMDAIRKVLDDDQWERLQNPVKIELKAGEAGFHHPLMIHGSRENHSDRPRRAVVLNAVRDGVCSDSDEPLLKGTPPLGIGQPMSGRFFPLLYSPGKRDVPRTPQGSSQP